MSGALTLARHSLRRGRTLLVVLLVVLAGFEVLLVTGAATLQQSGTFGNIADMMPPFVRQMFGDSLIVFMSFSGIVCFGYFHPMIVAVLAGFVIAIATEPVSDIETRFLDVILARPLARSAVVGRTVLLLVALPAIVVGAMLASTTISLHVLAPGDAEAPTSRLIGSLAVNLWALLLCIGGVSLAVAAIGRRRATVGGVLGIGGLALFLVDYVARIWKPATHVAWLSPFHYFDAMTMVMGGGLPVWHVEVLVGAGAAGVALAFVLFSRRDL